MLGQQFYACQGEVVEVGSANMNGRIKLNFLEIEEPNLIEVKRKKDALSLQYFPGYRLAQSLGISSHLLSRITGSVFISKSPRETEPDRQSKVNVGLNLKVMSLIVLDTRSSNMN